MATLGPIIARTGSSVTLTLTAGGGETAWEIETNRSEDFNADESYFIPVAAAGNIAINDLVPDTPYYFRTRKTNGGNGAWSATFMAATGAPAAAPVPAYTGFSIIPALLVVPEPIVDLVGTNVAAGSDVNNLNNDDPMNVFKVAGASSAITFRTTGRAIDTFALLGSLANESVTWRLRGAATATNVTAAPTTDTGVVSFRVSNGLGRRRHYHAFRRLAAPVTSEYWRIDLAGITANFIARHLVVGFARSSVNVSRGAGHEANDMGSFGRTMFGSPDRVRGWRGRKVEFPLSWVSEAEYEAKWRDLQTLVGSTEPVLALQNPKSSIYLNERIAYGTIQSDRGEMMRGEKYAKTLDINSLY